jgi:hypothetical protein
MKSLSEIGLHVNALLGGDSCTRTGGEINPDAAQVEVTCPTFPNSRGILKLVMGTEVIEDNGTGDGDTFGDEA